MGQLKALFGLDRDPVLIVDRPGWDSTAGSNTWTFLESTIDPMVDRLDEKHGGFYLFHRASICRLRMPANPPSEYPGSTAMA